MIKGVIVMKKKLLLILPIMLFAIFYFVGDADAGSKTLNLTTDSYTLSQGKTLQLKINGVKAKKVKWKSSNKKVATVSKNGTVKAVKSGKATISGKYKGITFKTNITVHPSGKEYNLLLAEDKNLAIYLKKVEDGYIYLEFENKCIHDLTFWNNYIEINGKDYPGITIYDFVYEGKKTEYKLVNYDQKSNIVKYNFKNGTLKGQIEYDDNGSGKVYGKLKFDVTVE